MSLLLLFNQPGAAGSPFTAGPATNLFFLFNEAARAATLLTQNTGATAAGYNTTDVMSGPRSRMWRSVKFSAAEINYSYGSNIGISYCVVARADLLITSAGTQVVGRQRDAGGAWTDIPAFNYNPLTAGALIGPRSQDLVVPTTPANQRGFGLYCGCLSGSQAAIFSKLYAGGAFGFSVPPNRGVQWQDLPPETYAVPLKGTKPYEIERSFSLTFAGVKQSERTQFLLYDGFYSPFFLYDSTGDIWQHKLEHVILTGFTETMLEVDTYTITMEFARLRHYE